MSDKFAIWLQAELDRRGITARELARVMGSSPATIYRIINGERGVGRGVAAKIAKALNVPDTVVLYQAGFIEHDPADPSQALDPLTLDLLRLLARRTEAERAMVVEAATSLLALVDRGKREALTGDGKATARKNQVGS